MMRLIDADALCEEFKRRQRAALRWKEEAILADNEESKIRADAVLAFLSEVKLTIDNAPTVEQPIDEWCTDCKEYDHEKNCCPRFNRVIRETLKDAQPTGEWIECTKSGMPLTEYGRMTGEKWYGFKCSQCNFIYKGNALIDSPFCQKCGAKMKGGEKE